MNRRKFLKAAGSAGFASVAGAFARRVYAQKGAGATGNALVNVATAIIQGFPSCLDYRIVYVNVYPDCEVVFRHNMPVAFVEVTKSTGEFIFVDGKDGKKGTEDGTVFGKQSFHREEAGYEARVWILDEDMRNTLSYSIGSCIFCPDDEARRSGGSMGAATSDTDVEGLEKVVGMASEDNEVCKSLQEYSSLLMSALSSDSSGGSGGGGSSDSEMILAYDSGLDPLNWRTGCRDFISATSNTFDAISECTIGGGDYGVSWFEENAKTEQAYEYIVGDQPCIGEWGALLPRQLRQLGVAQNVGAAVAAYRALHLAHHDIKTFPYEVSLRSKMQPIYPKVAKCLHPGAPAGEVDSKIKTSEDGRYGFFLWVPVRCIVQCSDYLDCDIGA